MEKTEQVWVQGTGTDVSIEGALTVTYQVPDPEPPKAPWDFKALFARDEDFTAAYAKLNTLGCNVMEVAAFSGSGNNQLIKRLDLIQAPHTGWILFGSGFKASSTGGSFGISDSKLDALMTNGGQGEVVANHPRNSHRYCIADEIDLTAFLGNATQLKANLDTIKRRADRVVSHDPKAICGSTDFRKEQLEPGIWKGVLHEIWCDGYANWVPYVEDFIPNQAKWCENAGIPYLAVHSCHAYNTNEPKYPTPAEFDKGVDQWRATKARAFGLYIWNDGGTDKSLHTDTTMQTHIGQKMGSIS